jgi:3-oxo-5-alpha-steroid 4-dehydrogenase 1
LGGIITESNFFNLVIGVSVCVGVIVFTVLFFYPAPYGRHNREGWGPQINNRLGWIIMEAVSPAGFFIFFMLGSWKTGVMPYIFMGLWLVHYLYRSFLFPTLIRGDKRMPVLIMLFAVLFNLMNSYLQGRHLYCFSPQAAKYPTEWMVSGPFLVGVILFFTGFVIHVISDSITRNLRGPGEKGYKIPYGGLFRWISCPNYFGEIVEWIGWAILTWSIPGLVFAFWTAANLVPRAYSNHRWYRKTFPDYPPDRRAIIPFVL